MGPCNLEIHEIRNFGQVRGFTAIWLNKFLSGEFRVFRGKMVIILVSSVGLAAIQTNKFLSGEFHVFCGKMVIIGFGHCHGNLAVK